MMEQNKLKEMTPEEKMRYQKRKEEWLERRRQKEEQRRKEEEEKIRIAKERMNLEYRYCTLHVQCYTSRFSALPPSCHLAQHDCSSTQEDIIPV